MSDSDIERMLGLLGHETEAWEPWKEDGEGEGAAIAGTVTDVSYRDGDWGPYPVLELRDGAGDHYSVPLYHTVLKNEFAKRNPQLGDTVGIAYKGRKQTKGGQSFHSSELRVIPAAGTPNVAPSYEGPDPDDLA